MAWTLYNGTTPVCEVKKLTYNGIFMGERSVSFSVTSPTPINFRIGDWLVYRGERFELNYNPAREKVSSKGSYGEAFKYDDIKLNSFADELTRVDFLDYVKNDNQIHYSGLSKFSFYASSVKALAERIKVNLDRIYKNEKEWTLNVNPALDNVEMNIEVTTVNCFEALALVNEKWNLFFTITGRTILIGYDLITLPTEFTYKADGLFSLKQDTKQDVKLITRLRAFGSTRNMPFRFYNGKGNVPESMFVPNLMLPGFINSGGDMFIDSPNIAAFGIREATVYFDGSSGNEEIYPTIRNMTAARLATAGLIVTLPPNDNGNLDETLGSSGVPNDNGIIQEGDPVGEFQITLKDIGFNISDYLSSAGEATISMEGGRCIGREFTITKVEEDTSQGYKTYILTCNRFLDTDISVAFPNNAYTINAGDKFILLNIAMPDIYIEAASQRLLEEAKRYLELHDKPRYTFDPKIWSGYLANRLPLADSLVEGKLMPVKDTDLEIQDTIPIQVLTIKEGESLLSQYEVTLSEELVVSRIDKIIDNVKKVEQEVIRRREDIVRFTRQSWRHIQEVRREIANELLPEFGDSISPLTIETMMALVGSEQLQFVFVDSKTEPQHVISTVPQYDDTTGVLTIPASILKHLTLGINAISSSHNIADYKYWDIEALTTGSLVSDKLLRIYVRCSKTDTAGKFIVSEDVIAIEQEAGYYHFLMGYLTSEFDGLRSFSRLYGFTAILPGQVITDIIQDPTGNLTIDLVAATIYALNGAKIVGRIEIQSGSSGITNFDDWVSEKTEIQNFVTAITDNLQNQIDGHVISWFFEYDPTYYNLPASSWTTDAEREAHLNDTFTNLLTGASWRWTRTGSQYEWTVIADTATQQALIAAGKAQDTADSKRRTFIQIPPAYPVPPYDVGDLWAQGATGELMKCVTAKSAGQSYAASDWQKASKYTDDAALSNWISNTYANDKGLLQQQIDGKIETWYQSNDPSASWTTAERSYHTGDIWYNTSSQVTYRWNGSSWSVLTDADAVAAKTLAEGKNTVFLTQPSNYKLGDLWILNVAGVFGSEQCYVGDILTAGAASVTYNAAHWSRRARFDQRYDFTKTTIDGGLITTGRIQLGGNNYGVNAGISGAEESSNAVRFWSGSTYENRTNATFKVLHNGAVYTGTGFYVNDANGNPDAGFQNTGSAGTSSIRLWVGGSTTNPKMAVSSMGYIMCPRLYVGDGTDASSTRITVEAISIGGDSNPPSMERYLAIRGNTTYAPRLQLLTGENTIPFFQIQGAKYNSVDNMRPLIRVFRMPLENHMSTFISQMNALHGTNANFATGAMGLLKYHQDSGLIFVDWTSTATNVRQS